VRNPLVQNLSALKILYFEWQIINEFMAIFSVFQFYFIFPSWVGESFLHDLKEMLGFFFSSLCKCLG
jgi:hypothetical protein